MYIFQDLHSPFYLQPLEPWGHSPQQTSQSNPGPHFSKCMQNDVTSLLRSLSSFRKKTIVYYSGIQIPSGVSSYLYEGPFVLEESFPSDPSSFETHLNPDQSQSAELDGSMDLQIFNELEF